MRKCTRVSLKRPCSFRIRWGFLHFPAVFPTGIFSFFKKKYIQSAYRKKKKRNLSLLSHGFVVVITVVLCTNHARMNAAIWSTARRAGSPRTFFFLFFFFREVLFVKGGKTRFFRAKLKKLCRINVIVMALLTSPPRAIIRRHGCTTSLPCKDTQTSNTTASSFTTGRTVK